MQDDTFQEILNRASTVTRSPYIGLCLLDREAGYFVVKATKGRNTKVIERALREARRILPDFSPKQALLRVKGNALLEKLLRTRETIVIDDLRDLLQNSYPEVFARIGRRHLRFRGAILSPILIGSEVEGLLSYLYRGSPTHRDVLISEAFARQASLVLELSGLLANLTRYEEKFRETEQRLERLRISMAEKGPEALRSWPTLSRREAEVATLVAAGLANKEIAQRLFISLNTANTHVRHIFRKIGVRTRVGLLLKILGASGDTRA